MNLNQKNGLSQTQPIPTPSFDDRTRIWNQNDVLAEAAHQRAEATRESVHDNTIQRTPEAPQKRPHPVKKSNNPQPPQNHLNELPKKKKKKKKKTKHPIGCGVVWTLFLLIVVLFGGYSAFVLAAIGKMDKEPRAIRALTSSQIYSNDSVRNILVIGSDTRTEERGRADSMILLSISDLNHTITMTSIMRDSYVSIPGHGTDKLNAAFSYGGATLLMDTIQDNFCIEINDYICLDFTAMAAITDAFGGVEITLSDSEANAVNAILHDEVNAIMGDPQDSDYLPSGGTYTLNGKQALSYSRIRYVGNADFERTERQRTVLNGLLGKAKLLTPSKLTALVHNACPMLSTNCSTGDLYLLSLKAPYALAFYDMQQLRMPADDTYSNRKTESGAMVLAVDFDANLTLYKQAVTEKTKAGANDD